jgi:hypothetical protein
VSFPRVVLTDGELEVRRWHGLVDRPADHPAAVVERKQGARTDVFVDHDRIAWAGRVGQREETDEPRHQLRCGPRSEFATAERITVGSNG